MRKALSIILTAVCLITSLSVSCFAYDVQADIDISLNSNIAGLSEADLEELVSINSDGLIFDDNPVLISDYAGTYYPDAMKAGRTYYIYYTFTAADGYELPENISSDTVTFSCGKNCSVISVYEVRCTYGDGTYYRGVTFFVKVVTDSNALVRFIGMISDWILKLKAWSLY